MPLSVSFFGAAGTVTESRYLIEDGDSRILVDCWLFQGHKELRTRNWVAFPVPPSTIDTVLLTHAHIDHSGYLPALVRDGFAGRIYCSHASMELCDILLRDSAFLQEKDAAYANRHGLSKHSPAKPLYTVQDAEAALECFTAVPFRKRTVLGSGLAVTLRHSGHILGAATVDLEWNGTRVVFSGDLGRFDDEVMLDPETIAGAEYLVVGFTYGDRRHDRGSPEDALAEVINSTTARGGTVVIPAFAVGRVQTLLYHLERAIAAGKLRPVPVLLDSPMAINASELLCTHPDDHRLPRDACVRACDIAQYVRDVEESKALTHNPMPKVIISASGMATGGRVLHHLKRAAPERRNSILFAGFQAAGTRGAAMVAGAESIRIHGEDVPVRAEVHNLSMLSAHAHADEILKWLGGFAAPPRETFICHGEASASQGSRIDSDPGWNCRAPLHLEKVVLR